VVTIYVLRLTNGKYYVGKTNRNVARVIDHVEGKGAAWTKTHPPVKDDQLMQWHQNMSDADENRITLKMMKKYGAENVRGGDWCNVKMPKSRISELNMKVKSVKKVPGKLATKARCSKCGRDSHTSANCYAKTTAKGKTLSKVKSKPKCSKCGRDSHTAANCYAKTTAKGKTVSKVKSKPKCSKCGRDSHTAANCYAKTKVDGNKSKAKQSKSRTLDKNAQKFLNFLRKKPPGSN
jgi:predicted GIY-YIG superfamily endonuclease